MGEDKYPCGKCCELIFWRKRWPETQRGTDHDIVDFGAQRTTPDEYFDAPPAQTLAGDKTDRGADAVVCASKMAGAIPCLNHDHLSERPGVENEHMDILCTDGRTMSPKVA